MTPGHNFYQLGLCITNQWAQSVKKSASALPCNRSNFPQQLFRSLDLLLKEERVSSACSCEANKLAINAFT